MAPSSIDTWNSRRTPVGARAPETEPLHCTLLPLGAVTAPHGTLFCECWPFGPRSRSHFLCLDCLDLKVRLVHAGNLSRLRANGGLRRSSAGRCATHPRGCVAVPCAPHPSDADRYPV